MTKVLLLDNYDSFTYNLKHQLLNEGVQVDVVRNDKIELETIAQYNGIVLSPGPGIPEEAGLLLDVIRTYATQMPILGVCLGHQAIGEVFGAQLHNLSEPLHGVGTPVQLKSDALFEHLPKNIDVARYHSWVIEPSSIQSPLQVIATDADGQIMAVRHSELKVWGVQFHPESILTPLGQQMIHNWVQITQQS